MGWSGRAAERPATQPPEPAPPLLPQDAFLHISDFPDRLLGEQSHDCFKRGQRMRVYVREVDEDQNRVKVTAFRPKSLPKLE